MTPITLTIGVPAGNVGAKWMSGGIFTNENAVLQFIKDKFANLLRQNSIRARVLR